MLPGNIHPHKYVFSMCAGDMSEDDQLALKEIADFFEEPNKDLQKLMDTFFPDAGFKGFTYALLETFFRIYFLSDVLGRNLHASQSTILLVCAYKGLTYAPVKLSSSCCGLSRL